MPVLGAVPFSDKCSLLRRYIAADVEACELTVKRDGKDYYACIAVRGLQPCAEHPNAGAAIGLDMGVANPLTRSNGCHVTHHQGHGIAKHLARLERRKLRVKRHLSRKIRAAGRKAGALTERVMGDSGGGDRPQQGYGM